MINRIGVVLPWFNRWLIEFDLTVFLLPSGIWFTYFYCDGINE